MRRRGFSIIELVLILCLVVIGFFTFFSVFSTGAHHANQTQYRAAANLLAQSYLDEFKAHPYGTEAPESWSESEERHIRMLVKGRPQDFVFEKGISYENGSFVGKGQNNTDRVTLTIDWKEGTGNKSISVEVPVWR